MIKLEKGRRYITRCGRYVFEVGSKDKSHPRPRPRTTECVKVLYPDETKPVSFEMFEKSSHYKHGNWLHCGVEKSADLVAEYTDGVSF